MNSTQTYAIEQALTAALEGLRHALAERDRNKRALHVQHMRNFIADAERLAAELRP